MTRAAVGGAFDAVRNVGRIALTGVALVLLGLARGIKAVADFVTPRSRTPPRAPVVGEAATPRQAADVPAAERSRAGDLARA